MDKYERMIIARCLEILDNLIEDIKTGRIYENKEVDKDE